MPNNNVFQNDGVAVNSTNKSEELFEEVSFFDKNAKLLIFIIGLVSVILIGLFL